MSRIIKDLKVPIDMELDEKLQLLAPNFSSYRVLRKSVDARGTKTPLWIYSVEVFDQGEVPPSDKIEVEQTVKNPHFRPLIVGSGPAGLFAALRLVERGYKPIIFERGSACEKRILAINKFWRYGELNTDDNVCFGEGGAGLYSDGKLITRIKSPHIPYVMDRLVEYGAPEEIKYLANPHVGSDKIRRLIPKMRESLKAHGCDFYFNSKVVDLLTEGQRITGVVTEQGTTYESPVVVLATGHSAQDIFHLLQKKDVHMEGKSFALGLRIEHAQDWVNSCQFGTDIDHETLGAANYKLTYHDSKDNIGVYSFCMCPGGYVLSSGTDPNTVVVNGMSNYNRNSPYANAAIVVSIDHEKQFGKNNIFGGLQLREEIEKKAYSEVVSRGGKREIPSQDTMSFMANTLSSYTKTSSPSHVIPSRLDQVLPTSIYLRLTQALENFDSKMKGFISPRSQLHGVETRTSCPIRVTRDKDSLQSISHKGLYPAGEGAGYAGGITSAACDGVRIAECIVDHW